MGIFCGCGAQIDRRYGLCPKCNSDEIDEIKDQADTEKTEEQIRKAEEQVQKVREKTLKKELRAMRSLRQKDTLEFLVDYYNTNFTGRRRTWLAENVPIFHEIMRASLLGVLLPYRRKGWQKKFTKSQLNRIVALDCKYLYYLPAGKFIRWDERRDFNSRYVGHTLLESVRKTLFYYVREEIIAHKEGRSDIMNRSESLCSALPYKIDEHATYINRLFKDFDLEKELWDYRTKVTRIRTGKAVYDAGKGLASMTEEERKLASKNAYEWGLGAISTDDRIKYGRKGGERCVRDGLGVFKLSSAARRKISSKAGKIGGQKTYDEGTGLFQYTFAELGKMSAEGKRRAKERRDAQD